MKRLMILIAGLAFLGACSDRSVPDAETPEQTVDLTENGTVVPGVLRVKFTEEPADGHEALYVNGTTLRITRMERVFPEAGRYEERTRREGLHLWYNVWYEQALTASTVAREVAVADGVETAEPVYAIQSRSLSVAGTSPTAAQARAGAWLYDDPEAGKQWYLRNPGTETWQMAGADVGLTDEVWRQYHGDPRIVVAVVDGGIDVTHPDLAANLWTGEDGQHGWNFTNNSAYLTPYAHATHVAGLVAATNNNGLGISSIAGGDGTPGSGVWLMSCQIMNSYGNSVGVSYAAAIKYGADHGAVISQNSWGYKEAQETGQVEKDAIDYFIKYAGCDENGNQLPDSPMKGGIVLFATNNHNSESELDAAPANYEPVVAVAALGPDFRKASYSDYGTYIDIAAPGGNNTQKGGGIWSTYSDGGYGYLSGASMACPLVSATCALIIQKYGLGQPGFTPDRLKDILFSTATNIDTYNPDYVGKLGAGAVNIERALSQETDQQPLLELEENRITTGTLRFKVNSALAGDGELTLYNGAGYQVYRQAVTVRAYSWFTLDVSRLSAGYYTLGYACNGTNVKENFIKY